MRPVVSAISSFDGVFVSPEFCRLAEFMAGTVSLGTDLFLSASVLPGGVFMGGASNSFSFSARPLFSAGATFSFGRTFSARKTISGADFFSSETAIGLSASFLAVPLSGAALSVCGRAGFAANLFSLSAFSSGALFSPFIFF
ncbi:MAG TPA: hypothetical protein PKK37_04870, partial [Candidatus Pacearchaeota archaeon]|nr:hypothetical protein [Candidatus Pacearchaeota archaeon]